MKYLFALILLVASASASAATGYELLTACEQSHNSNTLNCIDYLRGSILMGSLIEDVFKKKFAEHETAFSCLPKSVNLGVLRKVYIAYANQNPEWLHKTAAIIIWRAFKDAYPCK